MNPKRQDEQVRIALESSAILIILLVLLMAMNSFSEQSSDGQFKVINPVVERNE